MNNKTAPTYAKINGPPDDWNLLYVIDKNTGKEVKECVEVSCKEGWAIVYKKEARDGSTELVEGNFELSYKKPKGC